MTAPTPDFTAVRFSTDDLQPTERLPFLREVFGRHMSKLDIAPPDDEPFRVSATLRALPGLAVASMVSTGALTNTRTRELIAADGDDTLILQIQLAGVAQVSQRGREAITGKGDGALMANNEPGFVRFPREARSHCLCLGIPPAMLAPALAGGDLGDAFVIHRKREAMRLLTRYVGLIWKLPRIEAPETGRLVATHIHDLVALAIGATRDAAELAAGRGVRAARLTSIKADILDHLDVPNFAVGAAAARNGVTPRYVQLLFEEDGTTFSEFLREQRLAHTHHLLHDPRFAGLTISDLAFNCGFNDLSYFNRAFRRRYGVTPSEVRRSMH